MLSKLWKLSMRSSTAIAIRGPCQPSPSSGPLVITAGEGLVSGSSFALLISTKRRYLPRSHVGLQCAAPAYNYIRSNPDHDCEWAHFTQAKKSHKRERPDSMCFAGKNWSAGNENAQFFTMGRLNDIDCTAVCRVAMGPIVYGVDGQAMYIAPVEGTEVL
ncbi:hypothetical protein NXS19_004285 [Fusarium pseudograminearum]|nr:hypothetical protein NXS19_004285 [Fusarium pseudograminearum]